MVLDHVADRARLFIVTAAPFHAERFRDGDLHMIDVRVIPIRLQQNVGEAQRHQILNRFLAEIMVDAENVALAEHAADHVVDRRRALAVAADRLLDDDARARSRELLRAKTLRQRAEQVGTGREIKARMRSSGPSNDFRSDQPSVVHGVDRDIVETGQKSIVASPASSSMALNLTSASLTEARNASRSRWRREAPIIRVGSENCSLRSR